jgi:hypothetical protein
MVRSRGKYVNVHQEDWSRIKEITHDGAKMGLCLVEDRLLQHMTAENSKTADWFAILMEDVTHKLGGYDLAS